MTLNMTDTLETTLGIIKPDGLINRRKIIQKILRDGFHIVYNKKFQLSPEQAADFLKEHENHKNFSILVYNLSSGPIEILILTKENAINDFRILLGPEKPSDARKFSPQCIRAEFGDLHDDFRNAVYGSANMVNARREIHFFNANFIYEPIERVNNPEVICCYRNIIDPLMEGLHNFTKDRPHEPITWLSQWLKENNRNCPIITEANRNQSKQLIEQCDANSSICSSLRDDTISSVLKSIMTTSSFTSSSSICGQKNDVPKSETDNDSNNTLICCDDDKHDPHVCPNCEKLIRIPVPNINKKYKKIRHVKCPSENKSRLSSGTSTNATCINKVSSKSSSSLVKNSKKN